jgi:hypothetical protein
LLDDGLPKDWPDGVREASRILRQGDVLDLRPLFYLVDSRRPVWLLSRALAEKQAAAGDGFGLSVAELDPESRVAPAFAILTSQTCDIGEQAEIWEFPWVQVAPVYQIHDAQLLQRDYFVRLTGPDFQLAAYVADLRLELPVEKGVLVGVNIFPGFETENDAIDFAETLGRRRQRAAVASVVNTHIRETMSAKVNAKRPAWRKIRDQVHKIMLAIENDGTRADPRVVRVFVVSADPVDTDTRQWFDEWHAGSVDAAAVAGLVVGPIGYMDRSNFDVRRYDRLIEINKKF